MNLKYFDVDLVELAKGVSVVPKKCFVQVANNVLSVF